MNLDPYEVLNDWVACPSFTDRTRNNYRSEVKAWLAFIDERVWQAQPLDIDTWAARDGVKPRTRARRVSSVHGFYNHAQIYDPFIDNPTRGVRRLAITDLPPGKPTLSGSQTALFLDALDRYTGPLSQRTRALGYLVLGMNLRAHQAVALNLDHWLREQHRTTARISFKGGHAKTVRAVPPAVSLAVDDYLPHRRTAAPHSRPGVGPLLTSNRGRRLDSYTTPTALMRAVAAAHPLLIDIAPTITCDGLAATPSPFTAE
nr:site-specific integrase [Streptomyces chartreusis]